MPDLFKISHRKTTNGITYTASFLKPDGTYTSYRSMSTSSRRIAIQRATEIVKNESICFGSEIRLRTFTESFFDWESEWARIKRSLGLRSSPEHCRRQAANLKNHILPVLGDKKVRDLTKASIDTFRVHLVEKGLAGGTINHVLISLRAILEFALDKGIINVVPQIRRVSPSTAEKGILELTEVQKLVRLEWSDRRARVATLIGHFCGFRQGEILGIHLRDIEEDGIAIKGTWSTQGRRYKNQTKNGQKGRRVPVPDFLRCEIEELAASNPWHASDAYLFYSETADKPMEHNRLLREFYDALAKIGINREDRQSRNLSFHSSRHFCNSFLLRQGISAHVVQQVTGHLSRQMLELYNHQMHEDQSMIRVAQSRIVEPSNNVSETAM